LSKSWNITKLTGINRVSSAQDLAASNSIPDSNISVANQLHLRNTKKRLEAEHEHEIIDVESFKPEHSQQPTRRSAAECQGYRIILPDGRLPHSTYPLALHDVHILPWTCRFDDRGLTLFMQACSRWSVKHLESCQPCQQLVKNSTLDGILMRIREGVHVNSPHAYYGFSGLHEIIQ
jgi:hypothetical protein